MITQFLLDNITTITPELAATISTLVLALLYYIATVLIHYLDNRFAGKQSSTALNIILYVVKSWLVKIEPGKVGRRLVEKSHPEAVNAQRDKADKVFMNVPQH